MASFLNLIPNTHVLENTAEKPNLKTSYIFFLYVLSLLSIFLNLIYRNSLLVLTLPISVLLTHSITLTQRETQYME